MGRIGGLVVALGIGVALVSGWSGGLAWADDSPGSAGTAASSDSTRSAGTTSSDSTGHDSASSDPDDAPGETDSSPPASASTGIDAADPTDVEEPTTKPVDASGTSVAPAADTDEDPPKTSSTAKRSDRKAAEPPKKRILPRTLPMRTPTTRRRPSGRPTPSPRAPMWLPVPRSGRVVARRCGPRRFRHRQSSRRGQPNPRRYLWLAS